MKKKILISLVAGTALVLANVATANTITPTETAFTPGVSISYQADVTSSHLMAGDGFTIFDVSGYTGMLAIDPNWVASTTALGSPWGIAPAGPDDPLLLNVTFTYNGPTVHQDTGIKTFSPFTLGTSAILLGVDDWTSRDHSLTPIQDTFVLATPHTDQILVPVPDAASTLGLFGFGLLALQQLRRRLAK